MSQTTTITRQWTIKKKALEYVPDLTVKEFTFSGSLIIPNWEHYSSQEITIGGTYQATNPGNYTAMFTPKSNYTWPDGTSSQKSINWTITGEAMALPSQSNTLTYNGNTQVPSWSGYDSNKLTIGGTTSSVNAGTFTATFTPKTGYVWWDGTSGTKNATWTIGRQAISTKPTVKTALTYTGSSQSQTWNNYDSNKMTLGGTYSNTNAGTYNATFTPKSNYCWADGSTDAEIVSWTIAKQKITTVPSQSGTLSYNGSSKSPSWSNYSSTQLTLGGTTSGTNVGSYTATFTPKTNYCWSDGSTSAKNVTWTIVATIVTLPTQKGTLTYTGNMQTPTWNNFDSNQLSKGGATTGNPAASATNAGTYTVVFGPLPGYTWSNGGTEDRVAEWTIQKATGTLSISPTSLTFEGTGSSKAKAIVADSNLSSTVRAYVENTSIASTSVSGKTITVTPTKAGQTSVSVEISGNSNITTPASQSCSILVNEAAQSIYDVAASTFRTTIRNGQGPNTYTVGDAVKIKLSGTVTISGDSVSSQISYGGIAYGAQILGFNHNQSVEGSGNYVDLQLGLDVNTLKPIAFCDSYYNTSMSYGCGIMNPTATNTGGYNASQMNTGILPAYYQLIESTWRSCIIQATKYAENHGGGYSGSIESYVSATKYNLWLLAETEIWGSGRAMNTNGYERDKELQYVYYLNGNTKDRYIANHLDKTIEWWTRTTASTSYNQFASVDTAFSFGTVSQANMSLGVAPAFRIG